MKKIRFSACLFLCLLLLAPGLIGQQACLSWDGNKGNPFDYKPRFFKYNNEKYFHLPQQPQQENPSGQCAVFFNFQNGEYYYDTLETGMTYRLNFTDGFPALPAPGAVPGIYAEVLRLEKTSGPQHEPIEDDETESPVINPIEDITISPHSLPAGTDMDFSIVKEPFVRGNKFIMILSYRIPDATYTCLGTTKIADLGIEINYPADVMQNANCSGYEPVYVYNGALVLADPPAGKVGIEHKSLGNQNIYHAFIYFTLHDSLNPGTYGNLVSYLTASKKINGFNWQKGSLFSYKTCYSGAESFAGIEVKSPTDPNYISGPSCTAAGGTAKRLHYAVNFQNIGNAKEENFTITLHMDRRLRLANPAETLTAHFPSGRDVNNPASNGTGTQKTRVTNYSIETGRAGQVVTISIEGQSLAGFCDNNIYKDVHNTANGQAVRLEALHRAIASSKARIEFEVEPAEALKAGPSLWLQADIKFGEEKEALIVPTDAFFTAVKTSCDCECKPVKKTCFLKRWCRRLFGRRP